VVFFRETLGWRRAFGAVAALAGALLVIAGGENIGAVFSGEVGGDELYFVGCAFCWAAYSLLNKRLPGTPLKMVWLASVFGALMLAAPAIIAEELLSHLPEFPAVVWAAVVFTGLFSSAFAYLWYYQGIAAIGAARAANFYYLTPLAVAVFAWIILGEKIRPIQALGGALVLLGVYVVNRPARAKAR
jgi:drug/metabolite transporter (DMT)-like permease